MIEANRRARGTVGRIFYCVIIHRYIVYVICFEISADILFCHVFFAIGQSSGRARSDPTLQHHSHLLSHPHKSTITTTATAFGSQGPHQQQQQQLLHERNEAVGLGSSHLTSMECESPVASNQPRQSHAHGNIGAGSASSASGSSRLVSLQHQQQQQPHHHHQMPHYQSQLQQSQHSWGVADVSLARHGPSGPQQINLTSNTGIVMGSVVLSQPSGHSYMTRNPRPSSSSTSSTTSLHHAGVVSPSSSTVIISGAIYDSSTLPIQHTVPRYEPQQVLLSSSSSSLSSSNLPVDLSSLVTLHDDSTQNLVSAPSQHHHSHIKQPLLITSPTVLMGSSSGIPLPQMAVGLPADLISAAAQPIGISLTGYPAQYQAFPQQSWPQPAASAPYPFTLATTTTPVNHEPAGIQITHNTSDRGDESPMVGVCIQQSPVASH